MTEAPENTTAEAASTPESQAERIQYLTPTPPVFTPEYDYTAIVESITNTANFATAGSFEASPPQLLRVLEEIRRRGLCRSCFLDNSGRSEWVSSAPPSSKSDAEWTYEQIQRTREQLHGGTKGDTRVLVIDNISTRLLRVLGAAIDLDPTVLWRHYSQEVDSDCYVPEMIKLRNEFFRRARAAKRRSTGTNADQEPSVYSMDVDGSFHMRYNLDFYWAGLDPRWYDLSSRISCCRVSANTCKLIAGS
jgi:hypothetical protein